MSTVSGIGTRIQFRRDTKANWELINPILADHEFGYDTTNGKRKKGDGINVWTALPYDDALNSTSATVLSSATTIIDTASSTSKVIKWLISVIDITASKYYSADVLALIKGSDIIYNITNELGDYDINFTIDLAINGANIEFSVINNGANSITVGLLKYSI